MQASSKNSFPIVEKNLSTGERAFSVAAGSYFLYRAFKKKSFLNAGLAGFLLYRGTSGYGPISQFFGNSKILKNQNVNSRARIVINQPRHLVYEFWRELENLPKFMYHLEEVKVFDERTSAWKASGPKELPGVVWISEIVEDEVNERIGWQSMEGSDISNAGNVRFKDLSGIATEVEVVISHRPAYGRVGEALAKMLNPTVEDMVLEDLKRLKIILETGGIITRKDVAAE